ncbi:DUF488 domain-containing protein [Microcystis aeruginosa LEGE 11464]|jgi:uncharacterized protein (DUF488 family)|uniref:DUF488 domain-containing protein n=1 Tax=Microcystis TaxID=1125 RepID=UPI00187E6936|nr:MULTISPECIES: DUF488 domain-containing protein [Microcystis]MBE9091663.1 DUF488 domain-containing protein [Microcystis aeruginosa LEGE 11464]MCA2659674.1 DUF488 domain-containing protein [Microcystis sp. M049S2]MCZ8128298.1 DUF488 domain-containing protein [Microcystis sp. LE19-114.1B]
MLAIFTIGHSNHTPEKFLELLSIHNINALADVRSAPYSRYLPHFNKQALQSYLPKAEIRYVFLGAELGARPADSSCYVEGRALYEKIAVLDSFQQGLKRIIKGSQNHRIALMCAEKDPITCHRAILVCRHLLSFNLEIAHIHSNGDLEYQENLEERLLQIHDLQDKQENIQLSLFPTVSQPQLPRSERISQAYQLQGDRIAYVEKDHD